MCAQPAGDHVAQEVKRLSDENKLREMLSVMCDNYNSLRKQYMSNCSASGMSRKRKAENVGLFDARFHGINSELSDEDLSCNKARLVHHDHFQPKKINYTRYVRTTQASHDTALVSPKLYIPTTIRLPKI